MAGQSIFITGSTGKIGQFLVNELLKKDYTIFLLDNSRVHRQDVMMAFLRATLSLGIWPLAHYW